MHCQSFIGLLLAMALWHVVADAPARGAEARETPHYTLHMDLQVDAAAKRGQASGTMRISHWPNTGRACLYLPYNDDNYEFDPIRAFDLVPRKYARPERHRGSMEVSARTPGLNIAALSPAVIELRLAAGTAPSAIEVAFTSILPRWPDADGQEWVFADAHPQPLQSCPDDPRDSRGLHLQPDAEIDAQLSWPEQWQLVTPATQHPAVKPGSAQLQLTARKLVLALVQGFQHRTVQAAGVAVEVYHRSSDFDPAVAAVGQALRVASDLFGTLPFPRLVILETADVEKSSLPGLIAVNQPRQAGMSKVEGDLLNWRDWQLTAFVAEQWFGASIIVPSWDDLWFLRGMVDFATMTALASAPQRFPLVKPTPTLAKGEQINFDYRQTQDLLTAVLTYLHPYNALTDAHYKTLEPFSEQHSLSYIRHALALRQISWSIGASPFHAVLQRFVATWGRRSVRPADFANFLEAQPELRGSAQGSSPASYLRQWWASNDWPDFYLEAVDKAQPRPGAYATRITIGEKNGYSLPIAVKVTDTQGGEQTVTAHQDPANSQRWFADVESNSPSERLELEPSHQIFDWNRFNNTDAPPRVNFMPGFAKTFADDAYTVLWLPLATKLPGQPLSLELVTQAFRYMHSSFTGLATYQPETRKTGYSLTFLTDFPKIGSYLVADSLQDWGLAYKGERVIEGGLYKTIKAINDPYIEYGLRLRNREVLSHPESRHQTVALKGLVQPLNQYGHCNYSARAEVEHTVHAVSDAYVYDRHFALADGSCRVAEHLELGGRFFGGELTRVGFDKYSGGNIRFHPQDVNEARLRFDEPDLARANRIWTTGADVLIPAPLPLPDAFYLLKRETKYRLFADYGESDGPSRTYKDAGIGLWLPVGIDLVGKGSVSVLNFSLLLVLYREAGAFHSRTPGVLFDFDFLGKI